MQHKRARKAQSPQNDLEIVVESFNEESSSISDSEESE